VINEDKLDVGELLGWVGPSSGSSGPTPLLAHSTLDGWGRDLERQK